MLATILCSFITCTFPMQFLLFVVCYNSKHMTYYILSNLSYHNYMCDKTDSRKYSKSLQNYATTKTCIVNISCKFFDMLIQWGRKVNEIRSTRQQECQHARNNVNMSTSMSTCQHKVTELCGTDCTKRRQHNTRQPHAQQIQTCTGCSILST